MFIVAAFLAASLAASTVEETAPDGAVPPALLGSYAVESLESAMATALGLVRRTDAKKDELVEAHHHSDGAGLYRDWAFSGDCVVVHAADDGEGGGAGSARNATGTVITDSWGRLSWHARSGELLSQECAWTLRPTLYRQDGYFKSSFGPLSVKITSLNLSVTESLEFYDPERELTHPEEYELDAKGRPPSFVEYSSAASGRQSKLVASFSGTRVVGEPYPVIAASASELLVVYRCDPIRETADELSTTWAELRAAVGRGDLRGAVKVYCRASSSGLRGFMLTDDHRDMRRVLRLLATQAASPATTSDGSDGTRQQQQQARALRRRWFGRGAADLERALDEAVAAAAQEGISYAKRSRHEPGKEHEPWAERFTSRKYPTPTRLGAPTDPALVSVPLASAGLAGSSAQPPSGFELRFTTLADCAESGLLPYGEGRFPAVRSSGSPEANFKFLPFPLSVSTCQLQRFDGPQTTRDRPYTIAESLMKQQVENSLRSCLAAGTGRPDANSGCRNLVITSATFGDANCTTACPEFLTCVDELVTVDRNFSRGAGRDTCWSSVSAMECTQRMPVVWVLQLDAWGREISGSTRERTGGEGVCLNYGCLACAVELFLAYFECAVGCTRDSTSYACIDCSFTYADAYTELQLLREKLWETYFLRAIDDYVITDMLDANFRHCAANGTRCALRENFDCQFYGTGEACAPDDLLLMEGALENAPPAAPDAAGGAAAEGEDEQADADSEDAT